MAKGKIERQWADAGLDNAKIYYLDLLRFRPISQEIAQKFSVQHESPQLLLIQDGECSYDASHMGISLSDVKQKRRLSAKAPSCRARTKSSCLAG